MPRSACDRDVCGSPYTGSKQTRRETGRRRSSRGGGTTPPFHSCTGRCSSAECGEQARLRIEGPALLEFGRRPVGRSNDLARAVAQSATRLAVTTAPHAAPASSLRQTRAASCSVEWERPTGRVARGDRCPTRPRNEPRSAAFAAAASDPSRCSSGTRWSPFRGVFGSGDETLNGLGTELRGTGRSGEPTTGGAVGGRDTHGRGARVGTPAGAAVRFGA